MPVTYSALAPPPYRGFIINGFTRMINKTDYCVDVERYPILGVVTCSGGDEDEDALLLLVYLDDRHTLGDFDHSGGLHVFYPGYQNHVGFMVVWCTWPPVEDETRLRSIEDEVKAAGEILLDTWSKGDPEVRRRCANGFGDIAFPEKSA
jgi:hypothetical protein